MHFLFFFLLNIYYLAVLFIPLLTDCSSYLNKIKGYQWAWGYYSEDLTCCVTFSYALFFPLNYYRLLRPIHMNK